jgi:cytochrome c-type biogenesis protein CcmH/NrfG
MNDVWVRALRFLTMILLSVVFSSVAARAQGPTSGAVRLPDEQARQLRAEADRDYARQNYPEALSKYLKLYPNFTNDFEINRRISQIYSARPKDEWRKAIPYLRKAHQLDRTNVDVIRDLAAVTSWAALYQESITLYRELVGRSPEVSAYRLQLARILSWAGQTAQAATEYKYYLSRSPSDLTARVELGRLLAQLKDYDGASAQYNYVLRARPRNLVARMGLAQVLAWSGQLRPALAEVEKVLQAQPRRLEARILKAYILTWQGNLQGGKELFQALARENPKNADIQKGLKYVSDQERARAAAPPPPPAEQKALQLAESAQAEQRYEEAIAHYREYLALRPDNTDVQLRLARVLSWNRQYGESEARLRELLTKNPNNLEGLVHLARVLGWSGKLKEAAEQYRKVVGLQPRDPAMHLELARVLSWSQDYTAALDEYRTVAVLQPDNAEARRGIVQALMRTGELDAARKELTEIQAKLTPAPELAALEKDLGGLELQRARAAPRPEAEKYFRALLERDPANVDARLDLADIYLGANDYPQAIQQLRGACERRPEDDQLGLRLARVLSWNRDYTEAVRLYRDYLHKHPDDTTEHMQLARVLSWAKEFSSAAAEYREVLKKDPGSQQARLERARALTWAKQYPQALQEFEAITRQDAKNTGALVGKGRVYSYLSRWRESVDTYDAALKIKPGDPEALTGKAQALLWSGDAAAARKILAQLYSKDPKDTTVLVSLASAENSLARPDRALNLLRQADQVAPGNADARLLRGQIRRGLAPELRLGGSYLRDSDGLNTSRYSLDFRFNLHPRIRQFLTVDFLPTSALAGLFGYAVATPTGLQFASRVPVDPYIPSPTLRGANAFPPELLLPGGTRFSQSAGQFLTGASMQLNRWFSWTAGAGAIQLRHGSADFDSLGFPSTRTRFIYTATPTFYIGSDWEISLTCSRQYWAYTPKAISQTTHVDEVSGTLTWRPDPRSRIALGYYHRQLSPRFEIPTLTIYDPTFTTPLGTFQGRVFKKIGNGATVSATRTVVKKERGELTLGYDAMAFGYNHPPGLPSPEFFVNPGIFTPSFYQRHAGLLQVVLKPSNWITWDLHGTAGVQQFGQGSDLALSSTAGTRLDFTLSSHVTLSLGYEYFNSASAVQAVILRASRAYHSNYVTAGLHFRF